MKRLIVVCDGTWRQLTDVVPTNALKIAQAIKPIADDGTPQLIYYENGLGTGDKFDRYVGGGIGKGIDKAIQDAYRFLGWNYLPGDEIYLFGFSRGAYTVRSLAGLIYNCGLLTRQHIRKAQEAYDIYRAPNEDKERDPDGKIAVDFRQKYAFRSEVGDRVPVSLLGCWDTVGSLGIPDAPWLRWAGGLNDKYKFHDTQLNRTIENALHAVAIDERRRVFDITPMTKSKSNVAQNLVQIWFPGNHGCVGGGSVEHKGLSDTTLKWMMDFASKSDLKLEFDPTVIEGGILPDSIIPFAIESRSIISKVTDKFGTHWRKIANKDELHESVKTRWLREELKYRPDNLKDFIDFLNR